MATEVGQEMSAMKDGPAVSEEQCRYSCSLQVVADGWQSEGEAPQSDARDMSHWRVSIVR